MDSFNYFNYFTEIEEYFWRKRGAHLLVSPLDWAIVETWQRAGIPLDAVLRGIDSAFESYQRSRRGAGRPLKSLAYCVDAVLDAATEKQESATGAGPVSKRAEKKAEPFSREELRNFLRRNIERLEQAAERLNSSDAELARRIRQSGASLAEMMPLLDSPADLDLENLERRLSAVEEKLTAALLAQADEGMLVSIHSDLDKQLAPYRRRMSAEQLGQLERQYTQTRLLERFGLPRLSLFYLN
jgi:hypothetical protein